VLNPQLTTSNQPESENLVDGRNTGDKDRLDIVVVEDNHDLRNMIRDILQNEYLVNEAVDGLDGMEKAESIIPDLIISDVMMPGMNGFDLCKGLKTNIKTNHIPVILLTAKASRENKLEGLETGADDYLVKPFDEEELRVRIRNLITTRKNLQNKFQAESLLKPDETKAVSVQQKFLHDLKKVIEANLDNDQFGVDELGREMAMSRSQVHRKLKALTDQSATTFIRNYRLHRAADLLKQDAGNVTEIAFLAGFNSQTYFSSSFQELFHCTPSEFRKKHQASSIS
jgi:DNA-binding response OmpR family regulator